MPTARYAGRDRRFRVRNGFFNTRFEGRENNNDFNSAVNGPTDATWLLTRARLGLLFHATDWLKFYVQGQDIRELGGSRPNNVGVLGADGDDVFDLLRSHRHVHEYGW